MINIIKKTEQEINEEKKLYKMGEEFVESESTDSKKKK